jgi:hypothetical protein
MNLIFKTKSGIPIQVDNINNISSFDFYKFYLQISRYFSIIWIFFTLSFTFIITIVFLSPNWIGDTTESSNRGHFGLFSICIRNRLASYYNCSGSWLDYSTFSNDTFYLRSTTILIGFTCLISFSSVFLIFLCLIMKCERVFHICSWIQSLSSKFKKC